LSSLRHASNDVSFVRTCSSSAQKMEADDLAAGGSPHHVTRYGTTHPASERLFRTAMTLIYMNISLRRLDSTAFISRKVASSCNKALPGGNGSHIRWPIFAVSLFLASDMSITCFEAFAFRLAHNDAWIDMTPPEPESTYLPFKRHPQTPARDGFLEQLATDTMQDIFMHVRLLSHVI
jgi:hypothetical protein